MPRSVGSSPSTSIRSHRTSRGPRPMPRGASASRMSGPASTALQVKAKGHAPELKSITAGTSTSVIIVLPPPHVLSGRFVDTRGKPIAGAYVYMAGWRRSWRWSEPQDRRGWQVPMGRRTCRRRSDHRGTDGYDGVASTRRHRGRRRGPADLQADARGLGQPARRRDRRSRQPGRGGGRGDATPPARALRGGDRTVSTPGPGASVPSWTPRQGPSSGCGSSRRDMSRSSLGNSVATRGKWSTTSS